MNLFSSILSKSRINFQEDVRKFSYYEYKYLVHHHQLHTVKSLLEELYGGSDPFPFGTVDSIYYDTIRAKLFQQCANGEDIKWKFRIRGYGDGVYRQIQQKIKVLSSVRKYKASIHPVSLESSCSPLWESLQPLNFRDRSFHKISLNSATYGFLLPSVRIRYCRYRYRTYDYRFTLDTNIEAQALINGFSCEQTYARLGFHVLEIKTRKLRPNLPFVGLVQLPQVSFSKFMLGIQQLNNWG